MYHLYTVENDGVWINRYNADVLDEVKLVADQKYADHDECHIQRNTSGHGEHVLSRHGGDWSPLPCREP